MSRCLDLSAWTGVVRGDVPDREGFRVALHLLECGACRSQLHEARRIVQALAPPVPHAERVHDEHEDLAALAEALARREIPAGAWSCEACVELLLASLESIRDPERGAAPSLAFPPPARRSRPAWFWFAGSLAAAAAAVFALFAFAPPGPGWARAAGLRRIQVWRLPAEVAEDVRRVASGGGLTTPRFTLPSGPLEVERDPEWTPTAPRIVSPRWETALEARPEFRWSGMDAHAEVFLLDAERKFLWSAASDEAGRMPFPATAAPLVAGATYYWKVNLLGDEQVHASAYAGFTVLNDEEAARCRADLERAGSAPFVEGVVAERCGLYTRAATAFDAAARSIGNPAAARLARELRQRQGLEDEGVPR
jgi:hypothetical protein